MTGNALFYQASGQLPLVSHADGIYIWDVDGKRYIDACSGAITCNLGHNHPAVKAAMAEQLDRVAFSYRTQFESQVAIDLAEELVELTQGDLDKVFFVGSGSEAVESAMKLARQYFVSIGQSQRTHFVSLRPSYHGSTLGALSLTGYQPLEAPFTDITLGSIKVPSPDFYRYQENTLEEHVASVLAETDAAIAEVGGEHIIAIAIEPVGGASTGARMLNRQYMEGIREICDRHGCLLILDEVLSGMGRTGEWFAYQHWGVKPDLIALAKGMGAGYYPVAAMMARQELVDQVLETGGFMHGHTYAGNPLACATALAVVRATKEQELVTNAARQGAYLRVGLDKLAEKHACIGQVRGVGLLQGVEFVADRDSKTPYPAEDNIFNEITRLAKARGLLVYPRRTLDGVRGDHVLITPPLTVTREEIDEILRLFDQSLADLSGR